MTRKTLTAVMMAFVLVLLILSCSMAETYQNGTAGTNTLEGPKNLFDGDPGTKWCVKCTSPCYVIFSTDEPVSINGYVMTTGNDNSQFPERSPKSWALYGSNTESVLKGKDKDKSWKLIDKRTNDDNMTPGKNWQSFAFIWEEELPSYQYYMLKIDKVHEELRGTANLCLQLGEFRLITDRKLEAMFTVTANKKNTVIALQQLDYDHNLFEIVKTDYSRSDYLYWDGGLNPIDVGDFRTVTLKIRKFKSCEINVTEKEAINIAGKQAGIQCSDVVCIKINPAQ